MPPSRRFCLAATVLALAFSAAGCGAEAGYAPDGGPPDATHCFGCGELIEFVRPGVINFYGDRDYLFSAPSRIVAGAPVALEVRTYGGGCTREAASMGVGWKRGELVLSPYDRTLEPEDGTCTADLVRLLHRVVLTFSSPGRVTVRLQGRIRGALRLDAPTTARFTLDIRASEVPGPQPGPTNPRGPFPPTQRRLSAEMKSGNGPMRLPAGGG